MHLPAISTVGINEAQPRRGHVDGMAPIVSVPGQLGYIHACTSTVQYDVQEAIAAR